MSGHSDAWSIRKATNADTARIGVIARAGYSKYIERLGREPAPMSADFAGLIAEDRVVVIAHEHAIGGYMVAWPEADAYFVDNIAVDPAQQGAGLGSRLLKFAMSEGRRLKLPAVRLYTNAMMTENLAIYGHLGFVETHRTVEKGYHRVHLRLAL